MIRPEVQCFQKKGSESGAAAEGRSPEKKEGNLMKKRMLAGLLCLMLPTVALAVTEGVVEAAPQVEMESVETDSAQVSYLPDESYYFGYDHSQPEWAQSETYVPQELPQAPYDNIYEDVTQWPGLTDGEIVRAKKLLAAYQAGEAKGDGQSVLNAKENVVLGVYALNPDDYDGERVYVLLPGTNLTDEQLLAMIDAYAQLGLTFDPEALNYRNCARGGGIECTRFLTQEERERYTRLAELIERGLLDVSKLEKQEVLCPKLDGRYFCNMEDFSFRCYRRMTDEELVAALVEMGYHDRSAEADYDEIETNSRWALCELLGCPLSMELSSIYLEGAYTPMVVDAQGQRGWQGEGRRSYGAYFSYQTTEGIEVIADTICDWETKELVSAKIMHMRDWEEHSGPSVMQIDQEQILRAAKDVEAQLGYENLTWVLEESEWYTDWGACRVMRAQVEEDMWLSVYVGGDDGQAHGLEMERGTLVEEIAEEPSNE